MKSFKEYMSEKLATSGGSNLSLEQLYKISDQYFKVK